MTDDTGEDRVRSVQERRGDALVDVCRWFVDHQHGHRGGRHRPHLNVIIDHDALTGHGQGRLIDGTPLDAATTGRLLCDSGVHRVLTKGRSTILDYGRTTRTVSPELWAALVVRDGGCRMPWCDRGPGFCDAHHIQPWQHGGVTEPENLVVLCNRHHHQLHQPGWRLELDADANVQVTTPTGIVRTGQPRRKSA
jgi:5-methylcytosine-specific restriction protein A